MKDHDGDIRGFYDYTRAWYTKGVKGRSPEVLFGYFSPDGGTSGEITMAWHELSGKQVPCLECFNDAWHTLSEFPDLITLLAEYDSVQITPAEFCSLLVQCGFTDLTQTENPHESFVRTAAKQRREELLKELAEVEKILEVK